MTRVRPGRPSRGFTLIELLTTIVVMTILVGFAMPSFTGFMQRNALNAEAGALASALGTARANAISHNTWVTVAPVNNDWQNGWTVCLNPAPQRRLLVGPDHPAATCPTATQPHHQFQRNAAGQRALLFPRGLHPHTDRRHDVGADPDDARQRQSGSPHRHQPA
ncbi:pilus assembly FimT family protein [Cupriavidus basilensis]